MEFLGSWQTLSGLRCHGDLLVADRPPGRRLELGVRIDERGEQTRLGAVTVFSPSESESGSGSGSLP